MICYPIIIPTLNRYEHLKRCVESLALNTYAEETELVIGLDYPPAEKYREGYEKIKAYLPTITGFAKVTVFEREENYGPVKNFADLKQYVFETHDACISSEDDNDFSPCFLDFMNKVLERFKDNPKFTSISGYLHPDYEGLSDVPLVVTIETNAWGFGHWRNKENDIVSTKEFRDVLKSWPKSWKCFSAFPASFGMLVEMVKHDWDWGDVRRTNTNILRGAYQIRPSVTLCKNWGNDGSGLHCGNDVDSAFSNQRKCEKTTYEIGSEEPKINHGILRVNRNLLLPRNPLKRFKFYIVILIKYILLRISLCRSAE